VAHEDRATCSSFGSVLNAISLTQTGYDETSSSIRRPVAVPDYAMMDASTGRPPIGSMARSASRCGTSAHVGTFSVVWQKPSPVMLMKSPARDHAAMRFGLRY